MVWTYNGREVDIHDQEYSILEDPLPEGIKSTLIVRESQERHFGVYNCSVSNAYGSDMVEINLMQQSKYKQIYTEPLVLINTFTASFVENFPMMVIIVGVIGALILLIIVGMIVFLCQRSGTKKSPPESKLRVIATVKNIIKVLVV